MVLLAATRTPCRSRGPMIGIPADQFLFGLTDISRCFYAIALLTGPGALLCTRRHHIVVLAGISWISHTYTYMLLLFVIMLPPYCCGGARIVLTTFTAC